MDYFKQLFEKAQGANATLFYSFLLPDNKLAAYIIFIIFVIFIIWSIFITKAFIDKYKSLKLLKVLEVNTKDLEKAFEEHKLRTISSIQNQCVNPEKEKEEIFKEYLNTLNIKDNILTEHLKYIFYSAWMFQECKINPLIKNTENLLFKENILIKSLISLFIIIGLLGTLVGLAESLSKLSPVISNDTNDIKQLGRAMKDGLSPLLESMKSAFAPSILGVLLSIFSTFIYSFYIHFLCLPLKNKLENITISRWASLFYIDNSKINLIDALYDKISNNIKDIVDKMDISIYKAITQLDSSFNSYTGIVISSGNNINVLFENINNFNSEFKSTVNSLTSFQNEIKNLYNEMLKNNNKFQEYIEKTVAIQAKSFEDTSNTINNFESIYANNVIKLEKDLEAFLVNSSNIHQEISNQNMKSNDKIINSLERLSLSLAENLKDPMKQISESVTLNLNTLQTLLPHLQEEILNKNDSLIKMIKLLQDSISNVDKLMLGVDSQNKTYNNSIDALKSYANTMKDFNGNIHNILNTLKHGDIGLKLELTLRKVQDSFNHIERELKSLKNNKHISSNVDFSQNIITHLKHGSNEDLEIPKDLSTKTVTQKSNSDLSKIEDIF